MKKVKSIIAFVLCVTFFATGYFLIIKNGQASTGNKTSAAQTTFTVDGALETDEVDVASKVPGRIAQMLVKEGDFVRAGQVVAILETKELDAKYEQASAGLRASDATAEKSVIAVELERSTADTKIQQAQAGVEAAKAQLSMAEQKLAALETGARPQEKEMAQQGVEAAQAQYDTAKKTWDRVKSLSDEGVLAQQKADEVEMSFRSAYAQLVAAKAKLALVNEGARREEIEAGRAQVLQARAGVAAAEHTLQLATQGRLMVDVRRKDTEAASAGVSASKGVLNEVNAYLDNTRIVSPITGRVSSRLSRIGEIIAPGYAILTITRNEGYWVDVYVDESRFAGRHIGDSVDVRIPALDKTIKGRIAQINPAAAFATRRPTNENDKYDVRSISIRISLTENPKDLVSGLTARVRFE